MPWVFPGPWMPHKMKTFPIQLSNSKLAISNSLEFERLEIVRIIIQNGAEINTKNLAGRSPLHFAVQIKELEVFGRSLLVQSGADINVKDLKNQSPLDIAHKNGYITIVNYLMKVARDGLFDAICEADLERVKLCLENGAQINLNLKNRRTPSLPRVFFKKIFGFPLYVAYAWT